MVGSPFAVGAGVVDWTGADDEYNGGEARCDGDGERDVVSKGKLSCIR